MTKVDAEGLVARLRREAQAASSVSKMMAEAKSLRQDDGTRDDLYSWQNPEQTTEWKAADLIESLTAHIGGEGERQAKARREVQAVWRCAFGDVAGAIDILKNEWLNSRRKQDREAGAKLGMLADAIWANRDPAPTCYEEANASGKGLFDRVRAWLSPIRDEAPRGAG